jgi:hypothetical protein
MKVDGWLRNSLNACIIKLWPTFVQFRSAYLYCYPSILSCVLGHYLNRSIDPSIYPSIHKSINL